MTVTDLTPLQGGRGANFRDIIVVRQSDSYRFTEKKSLFLIFLYISIRVFPVIEIKEFNFEICFCKITSICDIFNREK
jgi:hypothetical protein